MKRWPSTAKIRQKSTTRSQNSKTDEMHKPINAQLSRMGTKNTQTLIQSANVWRNGSSGQKYLNKENIMLDSCRGKFFPPRLSREEITLILWKLSQMIETEILFPTDAIRSV